MPHKRATRTVKERENIRRCAQETLTLTELRLTVRLALHPRKTDLAPKLSMEHEPIPKSVSRVLDAGQIRRGYREKRHLGGAGNSDGDNDRRKKRRHVAIEANDEGDGTAVKIKPGETVAQFNRRVDSNMAPLINAAMRHSSSQARKARREGVAQAILQRGKQGDKARYPQLESPQKRSDSSSTAAVDRRPAVRGNKEFQTASTSAPRRLNDVAQEPPLIKKLPRGATKNDAAPSGAVSMAQKATMEVERDKAIRHYREMKARKLRAGGHAMDDARIQLP